MRGGRFILERIECESCGTMLGTDQCNDDLIVDCPNCEWLTDVEPLLIVNPKA